MDAQALSQALIKEGTALLAVPLVSRVLVTLGVILVVRFALTTVEGIYARLIRPGKNLKRYGSWALVTGATDGIGKAMAFEMAKKGLNILLVSRTKDKLIDTKDELNKKYPKVECKILDIDFANFNDAAKARLTNEVKGLDLGIVVNNVGISYDYTTYFHELTDDRVNQLISLNIDSTTYVTRIVLPQMLEKKRGAIINISSFAGVSTSPLLAQYGAAKSYVAMFSRALHYELKGKGIHVQCQVPLFVATKLAKLRTSLFTPSPSAYARAAVAAIGYDVVVSPFWLHALQMYIFGCFPEWFVAGAAKNMHEGIRKRGLKKDATKNKKN